MVKDYKHGGLKAADFESMIGVLKLNWVKAYLTHSKFHMVPHTKIYFPKCWWIRIFVKV